MTNNTDATPDHPVYSRRQVFRYAGLGAAVGAFTGVPGGVPPVTHVKTTSRSRGES